MTRIKSENHQVTGCLSCIFRENEYCFYHSKPLPYTTIRENPEYQECGVIHVSIFTKLA